MSSTIRSITLQQAQPGMILAAPVCDSGGNSLLAEGAELTAAVLASLQRRGVGQIQIAEEKHWTEDDLAEQRNALAIRMEYLFRRSAGDAALMSALRKEITAYRMAGIK